MVKTNGIQNKQQGERKQGEKVIDEMVEECAVEVERAPRKREKECTDVVTKLHRYLFQK